MFEASGGGLKAESGVTPPWMSRPVLNCCDWSQTRTYCCGSLGSSGGGTLPPFPPGCRWPSWTAETFGGCLPLVGSCSVQERGRGRMEVKSEERIEKLIWIPDTLTSRSSIYGARTECGFASWSQDLPFLYFTNAPQSGFISLRQRLKRLKMCFPLPRLADDFRPLLSTSSSALPVTVDFLFTLPRRSGGATSCSEDMRDEIFFFFFFFN